MYISLNEALETMRDHLPIAIAIIAAGALIAGAVVWTQSRTPDTSVPDNPETKTVSVRPVDESDHILGSPDAKITFIEYSDFECPYCKDFHDTMHRIVDEYGKDGTVAWVYRQFPIPQLHSKAPKEAEATECAAELGGNDAFWAYADRLFAVTPSNNGLDLDELPNIAEHIGLDRDAFLSCLESGEMAERVAEDVQDIQKTGARGTPHTIISVGSTMVPMEGAQRYGAISSIIETVRAGGFPTEERDSE